MTTYIDDGYLEFSSGSNSMKVHVNEIAYSMMVKPKINHYSGYNYGYDLEIKWLEIKATELHFSTLTKAENFVKYMLSWQGSGITVKVKTSSGSYIKMDGDNTSFTMLIKSGIEDMIPYPLGTKFMCKTVRLEQSG